MRVTIPLVDLDNVQPFGPSLMSWYHASSAQSLTSISDETLVSVDLHMRDITGSEA